MSAIVQESAMTSTYACSDYYCHNHDTSAGAVVFFFFFFLVMLFLLLMHPKFMTSLTKDWDCDDDEESRARIPRGVPVL